MHATITPEMSFSEAVSLWIDLQTFAGNSTTHYVKPRTVKDFHQYSRALSRFFAAIKLEDIHVGHIREYQRLRSLGELGNPAVVEKYGKEEVGAHRINQELDMMRRVMRYGDAWTGELERFYRPLLVTESDIPRALTPPQEEHFIQTAASQPEWEVVHVYAAYAFDTTASGCEMRGLQIGDLNFVNRIGQIRSLNAKNKYRLRTVPLSERAIWAGRRAVEIANSKQSFAPHHHVFPFRVCRDTWDPLRPMSNSGIKKPWDEVRTAAGLPDFMPHDTRHTSITRMAEAGTPIPVIMSIAGHISRKMLLHYTWVCEQAKRTAVEASFNKRGISTAARYPLNPLKTG